MASIAQRKKKEKAQRKEKEKYVCNRVEVDPLWLCGIMLCMTQSKYSFMTIPVFAMGGVSVKYVNGMPI